MVRKIIFLLFALVVEAVTVTSEAQTGDVEERYRYFFIEAMRQQTLGDYAAAFDLLAHCRRLNPNAAEVYYHQAMYFSSMSQDSLAQSSLEKAAALNPDNDTYQERVAQLYTSAGKYEKAIEAYEQLLAHHPDRIDDLNTLMRLYQSKKNYPKMLRTVQRIETAEGISEQTALTKMRIYELMDDKKAALRTLKTLVKEHPYDLNYKTMLGNWLMQNDKRKVAYKAFMEVLKEEPDNEYALSSLYDYYRSADMREQATALLEEMLQSTKTETGTKVQLIRQVINENEDGGGDSTEVLALFDRVLALPQKNSHVAQLKAAYMELKKMPVDSINSALRHVLEIAPDETGSRIRLIQNYWEQKDFDEVIALCEPAVEYNPDEMTFYYFMGLAHYQKNEEEEALRVFRRGVGQINEESNRDLASDFYAIMGDILHRKGLEMEAFAAYDSCLQYKDDNIVCLNNYAYYLSEKNRELTKAEQMSYRTVKAEPQNSTYLDTYAWILFKQERYAEAKNYIDQALQNLKDSANSSVIYEHAGDIYAMNGDLERAVDFWRQAAEVNGEKGKMLSRKIEVKQYIKEDE